MELPADRSPASTVRKMRTTCASRRAEPTRTRTPSPATPLPILQTARKFLPAIDREAANSVYCSCRCADADGKTDVGNFCTCPDGFTCTQLVNPVGVTDVGLTGAYCIKKGSDYQAASSCDLPCDPTIPTQNCAPPSIK